MSGVRLPATIWVSAIKSAFPGGGNALGMYRGKHRALPNNSPIFMGTFSGLSADSPTHSLFDRHGTDVTFDASGLVSGKTDGLLVMSLADFVDNAAYQNGLTYQVTSGTLPAGVSIDSNGVLTVAPTAPTAGTVSVTVMATNGWGKTTSVPLKFNIELSKLTPVASYDFRSLGSSYTTDGVMRIVDTTSGFDLTSISAPTKNLAPYSISMPSNVYAKSAAVALDLSAGFTFEVLFRMTVNNNNFPVIAIYGVGDDNNGFQVQVNPSNKVYMWNTYANNGSVASTVPITPTSWYHAVFTSAGTTYVNSVKTTNAGFSPGLGAGVTRFLYIGSDRSRTLTGNIALVRVYTTVVTDVFVANAYADLRINGNPYALP